MTFVLLGLSLVIAVVLGIRWFVQADPKALLYGLKLMALLLGGLFIIFIAVSGRWSWLPGAAFVAMPWLVRLKRLRTFAKNAAGPRPGQTSAVNTRFLSMELNHDTGAMDGVVREGAFTGRRLSTMRIEEQIALWRACANEDEPSRAVMESFLDRAHGAGWREQAEAARHAGAAGAASGGDGVMTPEQALEILGLEAGAGAEQVERAYRRMMQKLHPDHGGSGYFAAKLNQARDVLLHR